MMKRLWEEWAKDAAVMGWGVSLVYATTNAVESGRVFDWAAPALCAVLVVVALLQRHGIFGRGETK